jgi:hypothetical protein
MTTLEPDETTDPLGWLDYATEHLTTCQPEADAMRSVRPLVRELVDRINHLDELVSEWSSTRPHPLPTPPDPDPKGADR